MVIKNFLLATDAGLGHGETPILPHHNKLKAIYVYVGVDPRKPQLYPIPLDEIKRSTHGVLVQNPGW